MSTLHWPRLPELAPIALLVLIVAGCTEGGPSDVGVQIASVAVTPDSAVLDTAQTQQFTAKALDDQGEEVSGATIEWSSSDEAVATVDETGLTTALAPGTTEIRASAGGVTGSVSIGVREPVASVTVSPDGADLFIDESQTFTAQAWDADGGELTGRSVKWSSSDSSVITVSEDGVVTARGSGEATVHATVQGVVGSATVRAEENPVRSTSYRNFKGMGFQPVDIPLGVSSDWFGVTEEAHVFGDFYDRGTGTQDLFTASVIYDAREPLEQAQRSVYRFWRHENGTYVEDNTILTRTVEPCLHPRKALVADFNLDGRPDIFLACTGFDGGSFPGETNQILLSRDGGYLLKEASPDVGFWHGASAADLDGDSDPDVMAVSGNERAVFMNDGSGTFTQVPATRMPGSEEHGFGASVYFNMTLVDVDEDGNVDLLMGGHDWGQTPTGIWLNPGNNDFSGVEPVIIPEVPDEGVVSDFAVTGTGSTRTVWVLRTGGNEDMSRYYDSAVLQRFDWSTRTASVVYSERDVLWPAWIIPYTRNGILYIGSSDLRRPLEYAVP